MPANIWFQVQRRWNNLRKNVFFNYGLPFLIFIVGTSFALKEFTNIRYEIVQYKQRPNSKDLFGDEDKMRFDPTQVLKEAQEYLEDDYENIRGPREYEENLEALELLKKKIDETQKKRQSVLIQTIDYLFKK